MEITLLGTGGPRPDPNRQGPAVLIGTADGRYLVDAGRGVATQIVRAGARIDDLDAVFLTHHHYDHISGLGDLLMAVWNEGRTRPLPVLGPPGTRLILAALFDRVYEADIRFRMREAEMHAEAIKHPAAVFNATEMQDGSVFEHGGVRVVARRVDHGDALGLGTEQWSALGYRIEAGGVALAVSGDAVACPGLDAIAAGADVLVMCCYLAAEEVDSAETEFLASRVIASAPQVGEIASNSRVDTVVLTHFREKSPAMISSIVDLVARDFSGAVIAGEDLLVVDV